MDTLGPYFFTYNNEHGNNAPVGTKILNIS